MIVSVVEATVLAGRNPVRSPGADPGSEAGDDAFLPRTIRKSPCCRRSTVIGPGPGEGIVIVLPLSISSSATRERRQRCRQSPAPDENLCPSTRRRLR